MDVICWHYSHQLTIVDYLDQDELSVGVEVVDPVAEEAVAIPQLECLVRRLKKARPLFEEKYGVMKWPSMTSMAEDP